MTIPNPFDGHGSLLTFTGLNANIIKINPPGMKRDAIEKTHMATAVAKQYMPADLIDAGDISLECEFNAGELPPIDGPPGTLVIVWGNEEGDTWTWTNAFMTDYQPGSAETSAKMTASLTFKLNGKPAIT